MVEYLVEDAVALITLNRPPVNAISLDLVVELDAAIGRAADPAVRAVVVTGSPNFAAGADITGFREAIESGTPDVLGLRLSEVVRRLELLAKPTIAAVRGYALGGGLELAMGTDFIYVADDAKVGQPEIKLGIIPGAGGTQRLPRLVGMARARDMIYSGRFVEAAEAVAIGLAAKQVAADRLLEVALADAREWATGPTVAIGAARRAMNDGWGRPIEEAVAVESAGFRELFTTTDAAEGVAAFLEKRPPGFSGG